MSSEEMEFSSQIEGMKKDDKEDEMDKEIEELEDEESDDDDSEEEIKEKGNSRVHLFYYGWYGNPKNDGQYLHWNHKVLPHWSDSENKKFPQIGKVLQPKNDDVGADFYPMRGLYSSRDENVISEHLKTIKSIGIDVISLSYWGVEGSDDNGKYYDDFLEKYFRIGAKEGILISIHLEPYKGRSVKTILKDLEHLRSKFGHYSSFYRVDGSKYLKYWKDYKNKKNNMVPVIYVYDSYHTKSSDWASMLTPKGTNSVRGTNLDAVFVSLYLSSGESRSLVLNGGFDGIYTYFASDGFTQGSSSRNWKDLRQWTSENKLLFIPSVGPGYNDQRIRPWNARNKKSRDGGKYYRNYFEKAINADPEFISITSWNEWHEGTQIEESIPKKNKDKSFTYDDFSPEKPDFYLKITEEYVKKYK